MANEFTDAFNQPIIILTLLPITIATIIRLIAIVVDAIWNQWSGKPKPVIPIYKNAQSYWIFIILAFYAIIAYLIGKYRDIKTKELKRKSMKQWKADMDMTIVNPSITALTWAVAIISIFSIYAIAV